MSYNPSFDIDFRRGLVGEHVHKDFLYGTHEVKTDYRTAETGNFYIETWQKPFERDWKQSGINTTEADFWVQASPWGVGGIFIHTSVLKELIAETKPRETRQPMSSVDTSASKGRLVPLQDVLRKMGFV